MVFFTLQYTEEIFMKFSINQKGFWYFSKKKKRSTHLCIFLDHGLRNKGENKQLIM